MTTSALPLSYNCHIPTFPIIHSNNEVSNYLSILISRDSMSSQTGDQTAILPTHSIALLGITGNLTVLCL